jgi:hypothetical protein
MPVAVAAAAKTEASMVRDSPSQSMVPVPALNSVMTQFRESGDFDLL